MKKLLVASIISFNYFVGIYYGVVQFVYTILLSIAIIVILRHLRRSRYSALSDLRKRGEMPPVSILIPARNEEAVIVRSVDAALAKIGRASCRERV